MEEPPPSTDDLTRQIREFMEALRKHFDSTKDESDPDRIVRSLITALSGLFILVRAWFKYWRKP